MAASLKDYLKKYESNAQQEKKKQKRKNKTTLNSILVVDEDPVWQMTTKLEELPNNSDDEEKPQVDEDIDIKRMKRLELLRTRKPYHSISEDGSGWISVSDTSNILNSDDPIFDMSPPRKRRARNETSFPKVIRRDTSPARSNAGPSSEFHQKRRTEESDLSPPRKKHKNRQVRSLSSSPKEQENGENNNLLSLQKLTENADIKSVSSPHGKEQRSGYESDLSPPRKLRKSHEIDDLSPPRRKNQISSSHKQRNLKSSRDPSMPINNTKDISLSNEHHKSGLITGRDMKEDNLKHMAAEWNRFEEMDPLTSGRGSEPVYRHKITGERIQKEEFLRLQKKKEKIKRNDKFEWGKGLAQKREAEANLDELEREKNKPFARTRDDPDLDKMLKERVRWGDPMAHLVKKKEGDRVLRDLGDDEKMKESGFNIPQDVPDHSWIKRGFEAAQNRYGIVPGRHWDGIDRSNGFEKGLFKRRNEKQAYEREAYLWSVSDM